MRVEGLGCRSREEDQECMHYVSRLAMTEEAMCAVFGERNSGAYKRSGGDVGGSGM